MLHAMKDSAQHQRRQRRREFDTRSPTTGKVEQVPPPQRLVMAAIRCVERHGVDAATVRRITEDAGANVAAINYYFGSKDRLIEVALAHTLHEGFGKALGELGELMRSPGAGGAREAVEVFFREYLSHALDYPRISFAHLRRAFVDQDYTTQGPTEARGFVVGFTELIGPHMPQQDEAERRRAVIHVWATVFQLALLPDLFGVKREELNGEAMAALLTRTLFGETE
jgi:AcrR family transcriptional regulator